MRNKTRSVARSMIIAILTALAALIIGTMQSLTTAVTASLGLTAVQAIIVPGTGTPDPYAPDRQNYLPNALNYYVVPDGPVGGCALTDASAPTAPRTPTASSTTPPSGRSLCPDGAASRVRSGTSLSRTA